MVPIFTPRAPNPPQIPDFDWPIISTPNPYLPEVIPVRDVLGGGTIGEYDPLAQNDQFEAAETLAHQPPQIPDFQLPMVNTPTPYVPEIIPVRNVPDSETIGEYDPFGPNDQFEPVGVVELQPPQIPDVRWPIINTLTPYIPEVIPMRDVPGGGTIGEYDPLAQNSTFATPIDTEAGVLIHFDSLLSNSRYSTIRGGGVTIAIIDTGLQAGITSGGGAFAGSRVVATKDFALTTLGSGAASSNDGTTDVTTTQLHRTYVAGVAAANGTISGVNYVGIAPDVNLIILKVFPDFLNSQAADADIKQAIDWLTANAATYNIVAANLSLGKYNYAGGHQDTVLTPSYQALVQVGVTVVAASGNSYPTPNPDALGVAYPAADPFVWAVGSVWDQNYGTYSLNYGGGQVETPFVGNRIPGYSQREPFATDGSGNPYGLELLAPGGLIQTTEMSGGTLGFNTAALYGTSFAAPYVTGAVALGQDFSLELTEQTTRIATTKLRDLMRMFPATVDDTTLTSDGVLNTQDQPGFSSTYSYKRLDMVDFFDRIESYYKTSSANADTLAGWIDNDTITGQGGNDIVYGNAGNDTLFGEGANDILIGGTGSDYLFGGNGDPSLSGSGDDYLYGRDGDDGIWGGDGVDVISGENGADGLVGNAGNDTIYGGAGADNLFGGDGAGAISGADTLLGDAGNDALYG
ncbi:MAG: S8 family serine peptidase, partial [Methylocystis sp.]